MKKFDMKILFLVSTFLLFGSLILNGQKLKPGPQDLTFFSTVDETNQPYSIYIPNNFDETKEYPLVIFLHGAMSNNHLGLRRVFGLGNIQGTSFTEPGFVHKEDDLEASRYWPEMPDVDYIVVAPLARGTAGYQGIPEQDVYDMLDDINSRFNIDEDRTYLTGLSMGGGGTLWLGLTRPDIWAAIAPTCPAPPEGTTDIYRNGSNLPVHFFVGDKDGLMQGTIDWRDRFVSIGAPVVEYIEYPGIGHNSWEYSYKDCFIFDWFAQFERDMFPEEVQFSTKLFKYDKAYWVTFDNLTPGTLAIIDAKFTEKNSIEVATTDLLGFTLKLKGHPMFEEGKTVNIKVDGKIFTVKSPDNFSFSKENGTWKNKRFTPGLTSKQKGAEGPLFSAVSSNHIYVYGTADNPSTEELTKRRSQANEAANWAINAGYYMGTPLIFPRVVADNSIRQSDYDLCNLVLFGTKETNSVIAKFEDKLPMHLDNSTVDYGMVYIFPINQHYVLINSGLSWWTAPSSGRVGSSMMAAGKSSMLSKTEDFLIFKGTSDNVISKGNFDNNWKLPLEATNQLKSSNVVIINGQ